MPEFRNRIVEYGVKNADQFTANPRNPRVHPQFQRGVMKAALDSLGWIAPVIENQRTGYLVDGHERIMQALVNNDPVPYVVVDLDESEEAEALATFDPITGLATYDAGQLDALLKEVNSDNPALQEMLLDLVESGLLYDKEAREYPSVAITEQFMVLVECASETEQIALLQRFVDEGLKCRALVS